MNYKRLAGILVLFIFLVFPVSASLVSFQIVETGLNDTAPSPQYSSIWEGGLMSPFFDAGYIVTNNPIKRLDRKPSGDLSGTLINDFHDAALAGAEYFIIAYLEYSPARNFTVPSGLNIQLFRMSSRELIFEETFTAGTGSNIREEFRLAQNVGRILVSQIMDR